MKITCPVWQLMLMIQRKSRGEGTHLVSCWVEAPVLVVVGVGVEGRVISLVLYPSLPRLPAPWWSDGCTCLVLPCSLSQPTCKMAKYTVCPRKKETRFISEIFSLSPRFSLNYIVHVQGHFPFFHLIPNTWRYLNAWLKRNNLNSCMSKSSCAE